MLKIFYWGWQNRFNCGIILWKSDRNHRFLLRRDVRAVDGSGLENRRRESARGFESHSLRHDLLWNTKIKEQISVQKYPSGRRGSPAKGVGWLKPGARVQIPPSAPSPPPYIWRGDIFISHTSFSWQSHTHYPNICQICNYSVHQPKDGVILLSSSALSTVF